MAGTRQHIERLLNAPSDVKDAVLRGPDLPVWLEILLLNAALKGVVRRFKPHERDEIRARVSAARWLLSDAALPSDDPAAFDHARAMLAGLTEELGSFKFPKAPRGSHCTPVILVRHHLMLREALESLPPRADSKGWRRALCDQLPHMVKQVRAVPCRCGLPGRPNEKKISSALLGKPRPSTDLAFELVALCHERNESSVRKIIHQQRGAIMKLTRLWHRVLSPRQP